MGVGDLKAPPAPNEVTVGLVASRETLMVDYGVVKGIEKFLDARFDPDAP